MIKEGKQGTREKDRFVFSQDKTGQEGTEQWVRGDGEREGRKGKKRLGKEGKKRRHIQGTGIKMDRLVIFKARDRTNGD